jgi:hypothetical protein
MAKTISRLIRMALSAATVTTVLASAVPAAAEEITFTVTHYFSSQYAVSRLGDPVTHTMIAGTAVGPQLADDGGTGILSRFALTCPFESLFYNADNQRELRGYCVLADPAGDLILNHFECTGTISPDVCVGTVRYIAGTGKFAGVSGEATIEVNNVARNPNGTSAGFSRISGVMNLP